MFEIARGNFKTYIEMLIKAGENYINSVSSIFKEADNFITNPLFKNEYFFSFYTEDKKNKSKKEELKKDSIKKEGPKKS